jgi:hypothetical protein
MLEWYALIERRLSGQILCPIPKGDNEPFPLHEHCYYYTFDRNRNILATETTFWFLLSINKTVTLDIKSPPQVWA